MFHIRKLNNKINKLHERCLRIVYSYNISSFEEPLETDNFSAPSKYSSSCKWVVENSEWAFTRDNERSLSIQWEYDLRHKK